MKVTILTPTYNDSEHIHNTIISVLTQSYRNLEWIIIDDGSTDDTPNILKNIDDERVKVVHQKNTDQLNAIKNAVSYVTGDIVTIIHSDDVYASDRAVETFVTCFKEQPNIDGVYADLVKIDGGGLDKGVIKTSDRKNLSRELLILMGCNPIHDFFCVRNNIFEKVVIENYVNNNRVYFAEQNLNLKKIAPWHCYRVFDGNYIHSDIGKIVTYLGQFSTLTYIINNGVAISGNVIFGYGIFRVFRRLKFCLPFLNYFLPSKDFAYKYFTYMSKDLVRLGYPYILFEISTSIAHSFKVKGADSKALELTPPDVIYTAADGRTFAKDFLAEQLDPNWLVILGKDFDHIVCKSEADRVDIVKMLQFFSLQYEVKVK